MRIGPERAHRLDRAGLVLRIGIGIGEKDRHRRAARVDEVPRGGANGVEIHGRVDGAIGQRALGHFEAQVARHHGAEIATQAPCPGPVPAAHLQDVAQPRRGDDADPRALALQ
jgi:hypothetical protein